MEQNTMEWEHEKDISNELLNRSFAPIVLFVYNRLDHTRRTVEALQKNQYAAKSDLYIYSDAAKEEDTNLKVQMVRDYIRKIRGFKSINITERNENWGLARNIIDGVTEIVNQNGKIIVLEDDIVTSKYFLTYMNDALDFYKEEKKVMQIAGYMYPIEDGCLPETFFLRAPDCWGWATWSDRWQCFERNPEKLVQEFSKEDIYRFNFDGAYDFWSQVQENLNGKIYTWAIFWCTSVYKMNGMTLYPRKSLVLNIGNDQSGIHCSTTEQYNVEVSDQKINYFETKIEEQEIAFTKVKSFLNRTKPNIVKRIVDFIERYL